MILGELRMNPLSAKPSPLSKALATVWRCLFGLFGGAHNFVLLSIDIQLHSDFTFGFLLAFLVHTSNHALVNRPSI